MAYDDVPKEELITRDLLARDRTVLANERTLLAYVRTALALVVGGATLIQFFDLAWAHVLGWVLIAVGPVMLGWGTYRFLQVRRDLEPLG